MSKRVWRFILNRHGETTVSMPVGSEILSVYWKNGRPCLWAEVVPGETGDRTFRVVATGEIIPDDAWYLHVGTAYENDGEFVWHVFEKSPDVTYTSKAQAIS